MSKAKNIGVVAAMAAAAVCTHSAMALDLPGAGETYTVPSGVTNVISDAEIDAYNALGKVEFTDETSALRFTSTTAPNVLLKGAGWMIKDSDASWTITKRQTSEWVGTWDFRAGTVTPDGSGEPLFNSGTGLHDVYIRNGATGDMVKAWRGIYGNSVVHLAGQLSLGGNGSSVTLRQIEVEDDRAEIRCGGTVWAHFLDTTSGGTFYRNGINFNGHYLKVYSSANRPNSVLFFHDSAKLQGPGSIWVDPAIGYGIQIKSTTSTATDSSIDITDMTVTSRVNICNHYFDAETYDFGKFGLVRQKESTVIMNATSMFGSNCGGRPAYLLESGVLDARNGLVMNGGTNAARSAYVHFRQTGGDFSASKLQITNVVAGLNFDLAFGGAGIAQIGSDGLHINGDATFSFNDDIKFSLANGVGNLGGNHIWAYNGGVAEARFLSDEGFALPDGDFFAFNGGSCMNGGGAGTVGDASSIFGNNPEIRVYERGGGIAVNGDTNVSIDGVDFIAPKGNVLKSIELTDALTNTAFTTPPSVVITDATGSNAAAVVDYDFDSKKITNITIVSRGENYTAPTANLRYVDGTTLLTTPLACTVGPEESGDITFSCTNSGGRIRISNSTNYTHGTLIVDMDRGGFADGGKDTHKTHNSLVLDYMENRDGKPRPRFPNLTKIVVKSGAICISSSWGYNHKTSVNFLPNCYMLEMYGGHVSGGSFAVTNFTLGGTAWLTGHMLSEGANSISYGQTSPYWCDLNITAETSGSKDVHVSWKSKNVPAQPGDMYVDVDATPDGEPSKLLGGTGRWHNTTDDYYYRSTIRFGGTPANPTRLHVKNYESLRNMKGRRTLLDLSDTNVDVFGPTNVVAVTPPDIADTGRLQWSSTAKKLYWLPTQGFYLIFK